MLSTEKCKWNWHGKKCRKDFRKQATGTKTPTKKVINRYIFLSLSGLPAKNYWSIEILSGMTMAFGK
jgi:hypothetical protein